jgi:hypothetical protein
VTGGISLHVQLEMLARAAQESSGGAIPTVVMYTFVWIGGLVFFGFFAFLAPVRMDLIASQMDIAADRKLLEQAARSNYHGRVLLMPDDKGPNVAAG